MTMRRKGLLVLLVQLVLVLSIAAKYAWERHTCPMVWTRATQYDPQQPIRGRYLALTLHADACALAKTDDDPVEEFRKVNLPGHPGAHGAWNWQVTPVARNGKLTAISAPELSPADSQRLTLTEGLPCEYARLDSSIEFFISEHAQTPFPLAPGHELWALVTVPSAGPPRPVKLAVSDGKDFHVLDLR